MKTRTNDKWVNYSYGPTQTKQQVGQCVVGALLVYGFTTGIHRFTTSIHGLTRFTTCILTMDRFEGNHHLPPYNILCDQPKGLHPNVILSRDSQLGSPNAKFSKLGLLAFWKAITFFFKPLIEVRSKEKLQPLSRAFQRYVARHLHACISGQFPTFNGRGSNGHFDSRPFFWL